MLKEPSLIGQLLALVLLAAFIGFMKWLEKKPRQTGQQLEPYPAAAVEKEPVVDRNPGGPLSEKQAQKMFEWILQAAISQKAGAILIDSLSGRPQVRLSLEGGFQELTGIGDGESYRRLVSFAKDCAGLPAASALAAGGRGSFHRLYRRGHLRNAGSRVVNGEISYAFDEISRRNRAVRFDLESYPGPGGETLKIILRQELTEESTRFDLGFAAAAEQKYIKAVRSRSGIILLTGPCNSGKSTATYRALALLRDEGRKVVTVEWPIEWMLPGTSQYWVREGRQWQDFNYRMDKCLRRAIQRRPDVLMVQNIDWIDDKAVQLALDYVAAGGLLITAVHIFDCANALACVLRRYFWNRRQEAADLFRMVVAPRQLSMVCMHCAEEQRVPVKILIGAGMADPPVAADGRVATWRGRGCPLCENTGELGSTAVYEVLDMNAAMKRFIENENDWYYDQIDYLRRQAWLHGMRTQRELALERVLAGDVSLQHALLNTRKPKWLTAVQAGRSSLSRQY
jgi:type II secretory ATPase GspE/PulE/Tfp pilus assembly ATPase PilB-like protein